MLIFNVYIQMTVIVKTIDGELRHCIDTNFLVIIQYELFLCSFFLTQ